VELPNLEGQPGWVVVLVFALFVAGGLGGLYLRRKTRDPEEPPAVDTKSATVGLPPGASSNDVARDALTFLAASAQREAQNAEEAEEEAKVLRSQLATCDRELALLQVQHLALQAQLAACEARRDDMRPRHDR